MNNKPTRKVLDKISSKWLIEHNAKHEQIRAMLIAEKELKIAKLNKWNLAADICIDNMLAKKVE